MVTENRNKKWTWTNKMKVSQNVEALNGVSVGSDYSSYTREERKNKTREMKNQSV